jgi:hypothetical protein
MKFVNTVVALFALAVATHAGAGEPDSESHRFLASLASYYQDNHATAYNASLRSFYSKLRMMDSGGVLEQVARLQSFCSARDCDGMQPVALALADRLVSFADITAATVHEVLTPIFARPMGLNEASPNFAIAVGNSQSAVVRSLRPDAAQALYRIYGRRLADSPTLKTSIDSILTFDDFAAELCGIETHSAEAGGATLSDKEKERAEICGSEASSGGGSTGAGSTGGFANIGALINTVSVNACADVTFPPHSVNAGQFSAMLQDCLEASEASGELNDGPGQPTRLSDPEESLTYVITTFDDGTATIDTYDTDGHHIESERVAGDDADKILQDKIDADRSTREELDAHIKEWQANQSSGASSGGSTSTGSSSGGSSGGSSTGGGSTGGDSDAGSGEPADDTEPGDDTQTGDDETSGESTAETDVPQTGTSNTAPDRSGLVKGAGLEDFLNFNNAACLGVLEALTGGKVKANISELAKAKWPTVANPNPDGPFPWDQGPMAAPCGAIDVATGRGVACNLPILCGEGESLNEDCSCTSGTEVELGALTRTLDAQHCLSLHCDADGNCICSEESLPGGIVIPEDPLSLETPKIDE